jgi:drug/metabolite transporter (DMT)-like permease
MSVGVVCGLLAGALWGLIFLFPRLLPEFSAAEQMAGRYLAFALISGLLCWPAWRRLRANLNGADMQALIKLSLVGNVLYFFFVAWAVRSAGVILASLIVGILPITITLASLWASKHSPTTLSLTRLAWPLLLVASGIACINIDAFQHTEQDLKTSAQVALGTLAAVAALLCWTYFAVANARYLQTHRHFSSYEWNHLTGLMTGSWVLILFPLVTLTTPESAAPRPWAFFIFMSCVLGLGASTAGAALWNVASRRLPLTLSGTLIVSETVFALLYGFLHAQRWPRALEWIAVIALVSGVFWAVKRHAATPSLSHNSANSRGIS